MKTKVILVLFVLLTTISCEEDDDFTFDYSVEKSFNVFKDYTSVDQSFTFSILEVNDSRCAKGVQCIWDEVATVKIADDNLMTDTLVLNTYDNVIDTVNNYSIELLDVSPYPEISKEVKPDDYRVTLIVTRLD